MPLGSLTIHDQPVSVPSSNLLAFPICWQWNFEVLQLPGFLAPVFSTVKPPDFEIYQHSLSMGCGCSSTTVKELVSTFQGFCSCSWFLRDEIARVIPHARHTCCHWKKNKMRLMIPKYFTKLRNVQKFLAPVRYEILISFWHLLTSERKFSSLKTGRSLTRWLRMCHKAWRWTSSACRFENEE